jgi:hypothetical protein
MKFEMYICLHIFIYFITQLVTWSVCRLLGFDKLITFILNEWLQDIKKNQLPSLLVGVGPMHAVVQLCKYRSISLMIQMCKPDYKYVSSCSEEYICKIWGSDSGVAEDVMLCHWMSFLAF